MKIDQKQEVVEEMFSSINVGIQAKSDYDSDDEDEDDDAEEELSEDDGADWGDVDPNGGPAPSAPGSAV